MCEADSVQLGIPTANIPISGLSVGGNEAVESGVYYGWAGLSPSKATEHPGTGSKYKLMNADIYSTLTSATADAGQHANSPDQEDKGAVFPMVMSIGWNPFYKNTVRSVEVHIMHAFHEDFYESFMNVLILGFIRPELDYVSKEKLVEDIKTDIDVAGRSLARKPYADLAREAWLLDFEDVTEVAS